MKTDKKNSNISQAISNSSIAYDLKEAIALHSQGQEHGVLAEKANSILDALQGKDVDHIGSNNLKNGADRIANGMDIQVKYYRSQSETIGSAFEDGSYKYITDSGNVMRLEVPRDQYGHAVNLFKKRIEEGQVPGVSNPDRASEIVIRGHLSYQQARNLAEFGTLESLVYDSYTGAIKCSWVFGLSSLVAWAINTWEGKSQRESVNLAFTEGVKAYGYSVVKHVAMKQLVKMNIDAFQKVPEAIVQNLPDYVVDKTVNLLKPGSKHFTHSTAREWLTKTLESDLITATAIFSIGASYDLFRCYRGQLDLTEFLENRARSVVQISTSIVFSKVGTAVGNFVLPGVGGVVGGIIGAIIGWIKGAQIFDSFSSEEKKYILDYTEKHLRRLYRSFVLSEREKENLENKFRRIMSSEEGVKKYIKNLKKGDLDTWDDEVERYWLKYFKYVYKRRSKIKITNSRALKYIS